MGEDGRRHGRGLGGELGGVGASFYRGLLHAGLGGHLSGGGASGLRSPDLVPAMATLRHEKRQHRRHYCETILVQ